MAQMHSTVISANSEVIGRRIDENFGLSTSITPSLTLSTSGIAALNGITRTGNMYVINSTATTTLYGFTGGCIGQSIIIKSSTGATVNIHNSTGATGNNIKWALATGVFVIDNVYENATLLKVSTGTYAWTMTSSVST